jgi:hypothetical protein
MINYITEFISPYETELNVAFIGDGLETECIFDMMDEFNKTRKDIKGLDDIKYHRFKSDDLFTGKVEELSCNNICIMFMDADISKKCLERLTKTDNNEDPLDIMLMEKFISNVFQEKFIFTIAKTSDEIIEVVIDALDFEYDKFEYILTDEHLAVIIK